MAAFGRLPGHTGSSPGLANIRIHRRGGDGWETHPPAGAAAGRGPGVPDMARSLCAGQPHRASGELALHVLEVMVAVETSLGGTAFEPVDSGFVVPPPLPEDWDPYARTV